MSSGLAANGRDIAGLCSSGVPMWVARSGAYVAVRRRLSATPQRFEPPMRLDAGDEGERWRERKLVFPETALVVEGFPGSANSFVSNSLRDAIDPSRHVTSHFHHTVQLKRAIAFGVPTIVLVREPLAAASSLKSKQPELWDGLILWRWIVYHRFVLAHRDRLEIFLFDDVVADLDLVRRRITVVASLLTGELIANPAYRRRSEERTEIRTDRPLTRRLLRRARSLYERFRGG